MNLAVFSLCLNLWNDSSELRKSSFLPKHSQDHLDSTTRIKLSLESERIEENNDVKEHEFVLRGCEKDVFQYE